MDNKSIPGFASFVAMSTATSSSIGTAIVVSLSGIVFDMVATEGLSYPDISRSRRAYSES